jgi:hypothetical protein
MPPTTEQAEGQRSPGAPRKHHLDRRAASLATVSGPDDELLTTRKLAEWLCVSIQWLEIGRHKGYGPPYIRLGPRDIRYRRGDARAWLAARVHASTAEYQA